MDLDVEKTEFIERNSVLEFPFHDTSGTDEQIQQWIEEVGLDDPETEDRAIELCWKAINGMRNVIKTEPAADVAPVVHWISVKDRLPRTWDPVIVCRGHGKVEAGCYDVNGWWKVYGTRVKNVTHWRPLPEPPKVDLVKEGS